MKEIVKLTVRCVLEHLKPHIGGQAEAEAAWLTSPRLLRECQCALWCTHVTQWQHGRHTQHSTSKCTHIHARSTHSKKSKSYTATDVWDGCGWAFGMFWHVVTRCCCCWTVRFMLSPLTGRRRQEKVVSKWRVSRHVWIRGFTLCSNFSSVSASASYLWFYIFGIPHSVTGF